MISSPPHSAYNTYQRYQPQANSNSPYSQKQEITIRPASKSVTLNAQEPYKRLFSTTQEPFSDKNNHRIYFDEKKITPPIQKVTKVEHVRKKSQYDLQNEQHDNIKIWNTPPQNPPQHLPQHIESTLMNSRQT